MNVRGVHGKRREVQSSSWEINPTEIKGEIVEGVLREAEGDETAKIEVHLQRTNITGAPASETNLKAPIDSAREGDSNVR